nr:MAG TPA: protein of unknown function DUF5052 [Caudoviricetes sp.]
MRRTLKNIVTAFAAAFLVILVFAGCSEASKVNYNISKQANYFESERRVTVYNARTDKVILEIEGYISISNNENNELIVTCKVGPSQYKKKYVYLNAYTLYVVEDITGTHTDPYHYKMYIHNPDAISVELKP